MTGNRSAIRLQFSCILFTVLAVSVAGRPVHSKGLSEAEIKSVLQTCVDKQHRAPGIVVGVVDKGGTKIIAYGRKERGKPEPVDGDTLFEIGSITKVFTTLLLQDMVDHNEVKLDDSLARFLPHTVKTPTRDGREITLVDLATHTSGLPDAPDNFHPADGDDPWANYTVDQMYDFLSHYKLPRAVGREYEYSNVGMGLLGHVLALHAKTSYESLVVARICEPLGMKSTRIALDDEQKRRLALGHAECGVPVKYWRSNSLKGDGALFSSASDMVKFLAAQMGTASSPLSGAMRKTQLPLRDAALFLKVGLGWHVCSAFGVSGLVWHNGGTGGFRSFIGFDPETHRGAVVLANGANDVDDIGIYLTGTTSGLGAFKTPRQREVVHLDPATLDRYVGTYKFKPSGETVNITREGEQLFATQSGTRYQILAESDAEFFFTAADAQLTFTKDSHGDFTKVVSHQDGKEETGARKKMVKLSK
jgi:CubicO group peptidase (beta-lactamase class C family)